MSAPGLSQRQTLDLVKDGLAAGAVLEVGARVVGPMIGIAPSGSVLSVGTVLRGLAAVGAVYAGGMIVDVVNPMLPF